MNKLTAEWVRKAEADLKAAARLADARPCLSDPACFHCQQAVEKLLKALLQESGAPVERVHDLELLLNQALPHAPELAGLGSGMRRLTQYAVQARYPGFHATSRQAQAALRFARDLRTLIRKRLGLRGI